MSRLNPGDRERAIGALDDRLSRDDSIRVLTALAGSQREVVALPRPLQLRAQQVLLDAFPDGDNALIVSQLGIASVPTDAWLPAVQARINAMTIDEAIAMLPGWHAVAPSGTTPDGRR
ncbi:MAG: hypothetical protein EPO26_17860 [Chloroflexota bacterium]|nr:MAG: hypothetical protein EPO26_17860 [Chloroflexota bacterium]